MSEVVTRQVSNKAVPDDLFERALSHISIIENHLEKDMAWVQAIGNNKTFWDAINSSPAFYQSKIEIFDRYRDLLTSIRNAIVYRFDTSTCVEDINFAMDKQKFLVQSILLDIDRLSAMIYEIYTLYESYLPTEYKFPDNYQ